MIHINRRLVALTGEPHELLQPELLDSACARPHNLWAYQNETDAVVLGCALLFGIARNHPFLQGNKRTAFTAMIGFLGGAGFKLILPDDVAAAEAIIKVINGDYTEADFVTALREHIAPVRRWR